MENVGTVMRYMKIIHKEIVDSIDQDFTYSDFRNTVKGNLHYFQNIFNNTRSILITGNWIYEASLRDELVRLSLKQKLSSLLKENFDQKELDLKEKELELKIKECKLRFNELKSR